MNDPNVIATGRSYQFPDQDVLLPAGIPVYVAPEVLDQLLPLEGVRRLEAPSITPDPGPGPEPTPEPPAALSEAPAPTHEENL
ncbi:hypothetical protein [Geothrix sp. 21YS21S-2]|uniref:hypothetical protein n=1 Tax=Geothrix sp. 21YS21S-2 TaxID=3068893 RepID=UPI0027B9C7B2|nr:hypothetical protein [Geothrix sp. 21YS21S-2]